MAQRQTVFTGDHIYTLLVDTKVYGIYGSQQEAETERDRLGRQGHDVRIITHLNMNSKGAE